MGHKHPRLVQVKRMDYPKDVERIVKALRDAGYAVSWADAEELWRLKSEDVFAGWLMLDYLSNADIVDTLQEFIEVVD